MNDIKFPTPHIFKNLSEAEVTFRRQLPSFLAEHPEVLPFVDFDAIVDIQLLPESENSVVYKMIYESRKSDIVKISNDYEGLAIEIFFLSHWAQQGILIPEIKSVHKIQEEGLNFGVVHMNFVEGQNLRETLKHMTKTEVNTVRQEMGRILAKIHKATGEGYGRPLSDGDASVRGEFLSFEEFAENSELNEAYLYCKERDFFGDYFQDAYQKSVSILGDYFKKNRPSFLHGDYRAGNFLCNGKDKRLILIDPSPLIAHPYFDVAYNLVLNDSYDDKNDDLMFLKGYSEDTAIQDKELLSALIIEGTRMCSSWHRKSDEGAFEKMRSIVARACHALENNGSVKKVFPWATPAPNQAPQP